MPAVRADGSELIIELSVVQIPVKGQRGPLFTAHLRDITQRKIAEEELATRARYETGLAASSQALLTLSEPREALNQALHHLLQASDVSRVYIFENFEDASDGLCMKQTHEACASGVAAEIDNPALQHLPYSGGFARWRHELSEGRAISGLTEEFSTDERAILEVQGIQSILVLPIWAAGRWHGFVGFDDVRQKRPWNETNIQLLRAAASAIGAYIERRQVEETVRRRAAFEALIASISTSFIDLTSNEVDEGIERALRAIGEFAHVDRCYVFLWSRDGRTMSNTHEWCAPGVEPQIARLQELSTNAFPWISERLRAFETVHVARVSDLPEEAHAEREEFEVEGIRSIILVPMVYRGALVGHLGFDAVNQEIAWSNEDIGLLKIAGEMVVNAVERKHAEASLRDSEARNRALLNAIPDLIARFRRDGTFLDVILAQNFAPVLAPETLVGRNVADVFDTEITEKALLCMQRALDSHTVESLEYQLEQNGATAFFEARMVASGEDEVTAIVRDVSARKHAEAEILRLNEELEQRVEERTTELGHTNSQLQQERQRLADTLSNVPGVVFETWFQPDAAAGRVNFVSDHITTMLGYSVDEWLSAPDFWLTKVHLDDREPFERVLARGAGTQDEGTDVYRMTAKDGREVWSESQMRVMRDSNGVALGVRGVSMDITERKRAEEELKAAKDEADRANHAKSEFLSRMSHELRTPLNAILGFAQLLQMNALDAKQTQSVNHILKGGRHLLSLINEVLDISRIEAGGISLSLEPVAVGPALQEILDQMRPLAQARGIELRNESLNCDWHVMADRQRLKQVLLNLVSNAVKYNRDGGTVTLSCQLDDKGQGTLQVKDTGPGLCDDEIARLFVPFERLGAAKSGIEGTGIGLALSKRLVEAMEGRIGVQSAVGQGSTFWLELPTVVAPTQILQGLETIEAPAWEDNSNRRTLLYIEDNLANVVLLEELIKMQPGLQLLPAMQGSVGLELAHQHGPDLILLDLHLPDMTGEEVLRRLRENPRTREIPVIIVSADATQRQIQRLREAGAHSYLTKPFDVQEFLQVLSTILNRDTA
jgi:PAS domain S-box-containing protein